MLVKLKLIEYDEAVYATELDYSKYPRIDYTSSESFSTENVTAAEETIVEKDGTVVSFINISWESPDGYSSSADGYSVLITNMDDDIQEEFNVQALSYRYSGARAGVTYKIQIRMNIKGNRVNGGSTSITIVGKDTPPENVSYMSIVQADENITAVITPVKDTDLSHYELKMGSSWENSFKIADFASTSITFRASSNGTCAYLVKAVDTSGNKSEKECRQIINISALAAENIIFQKTYGADDFAQSINLYRHRDSLWMLDNRQIKDYKYFREIFDKLTYLDGEVYLPLIDLGENIIDSDCYYIDSHGIIHQQEEKRIRDYAFFREIFEGGHELTAPVSLASTFLGIAVEGDSSSDVVKEIVYRTSIDGYTFSDWIPANQAVFRGRFVQIRISLKSISGHTQGRLKSVTVSIDVPDTEVNLENIILEAGDNYVPFNHRFIAMPSSVAVFTSDMEGKAVTWQVTDYDERGCHIMLYDDKGEPCEGKIVRAIIRGY